MSKNKLLVPLTEYKSDVQGPPPQNTSSNDKGRNSYWCSNLLYKPQSVVGGVCTILPIDKTVSSRDLPRPFRTELNLNRGQFFRAIECQ